MTFKVSGAFATAVTLALTGAVAAQSTTTSYYQPLPNGYQTGVIAPAAASTYQPAPVVTQQTVGQTIYAAPTTAYTIQPATNYAPQPVEAFTAPQRVANTLASPLQGVIQQQSATTYTNTTPSYASPYKPTVQSATPTQALTHVVTPPATFQQPRYAVPQPQLPVPAKAVTKSVPNSTAQPAAQNGLPDTDAWSFNLPRFYPAIQACLRKSAAKNPVIANIQVEGNQTKMLIGEGGSSSFSTCSTGLTGTVVKAKSDIRSLPPAFFAPLGSTFTVSPDRPFQPIVDIDQKVIGWLVRTQPSRAVNQFGEAAGFDGQFIPPVMVNTNVGKS